MKTSTIEKLTWPLLYAGIILLTLGAATWSADAPPWTAALFIAGAVLAVAGVWLICLRSRMDE
jgi:hypothetical protein